MTNDVIAGVAGAGVFGGYHAQKYARLPGARLGAIFDIDGARAKALAARMGATPYTDLDAFLDAVDAVTIATPALSHFSIAKKALERGRHVLIEKPISVRLDHADRLVELAASRNLIAQIGHQERFVFEGFGVLSRERKPRAITCVRNNPASGRCEDVSVVLDLMIHDLDLVRRIGLGDVESLSATGDFDVVEAEIVFANGAAAVFEASRCAQERDRRMTLTYDDGVIEIDFTRRTIVNTTSAAIGRAFEENTDDPVFADPLGYGVARFIAAIRGESAPVITAQEGRDALEWALLIDAAAQANEPADERLRARA
ncbi:MAG: gfo/Idh/MocA family oxidoreductase [Alphaproteobacteria bacterium]|nr:gfo/Idh/MocA family oxidoreductase [Alphaproteobacteria bacterium]